MSDQPRCTICGEPMPPGEEMFKFHGYSGPCPKPPLLKQQEYRSDELGYATRLAIDLHARCYATEAPDWKPLPDLRGVLTQIDNMTTGMIRNAALAASDAEVKRLREVMARIQRRNGVPTWIEEVILDALATDTSELPAAAKDGA